MLPIPVSVAGSAIEYEFTTKNGDVEFSVILSSKGLDENEDMCVFENSRVPSDIEIVKGKFKAAREGIVMFRWNNVFSWYNPKYLSYTLRLAQPAFPIADHSRCLKARSILNLTGI